MSPAAIDICAGAGGLSLGLQRAGWSVLSVEIDPSAVATHRAMVGPCDEADVTTWHPAGPVDLVAGGVPCQPFSTAGKRAGMADPRGTLFAHLLRIADEASARVVMLENVRGMVSAGMVHVLCDAFRAHGYEPRHCLVNAADYGTPQNRVRLIVVGFRRAEDLRAWRWPEPSHGAPGNLLGLPRWRTVRDALGLRGEFRTGRTEAAVAGGRFNGGRCVDVDAPSPTVNGMLNPEFLSPLDKPAHTVIATEDRGEGAGFRLGKALGIRQDNSAGRGTVHLDTPSPALRKGTQLADALESAGLLDRPATTIDTTNGISPAQVHERDKPAVRLTVEQCAALQGFPDGFAFSGETKASRHRQVGNAVPPPLAEALGRALLRAMDAQRVEVA